MAVAIMEGDILEFVVRTAEPSEPNLGNIFSRRNLEPHSDAPP
jgi:hypothetical protein